MKFAVGLLIFTIAIVYTFADDSSSPDALAAFTGLIGKVQTSLKPLLVQLPFNLGEFINRVLDEMKIFVTKIGNGLAEGLLEVAGQISKLLNKLTL